MVMFFEIYEGIFTVNLVLILILLIVLNRKMIFLYRFLSKNDEN